MQGTCRTVAVALVRLQRLRRKVYGVRAAAAGVAVVQLRREGCSSGGRRYCRAASAGVFGSSREPIHGCYLTDLQEKIESKLATTQRMQWHTNIILPHPDDAAMVVALLLHPPHDDMTLVLQQQP